MGNAGSNGFLKIPLSTLKFVMKSYKMFFDIFRGIKIYDLNNFIALSSMQGRLTLWSKIERL